MKSRSSTKVELRLFIFFVIIIFARTLLDSHYNDI